MNNNIIKLTDSYKISHYKQYPPGTTYVYSYFESRGGMFNQTVFFGLTSFLYNLVVQEVWLDPALCTKNTLNKYEDMFRQHFFGQNLFNRAGWEHIINDHKGKLPLRIKAVPEGTVVPNRNVLMTVENTCPKCFWLTNYVETFLVQCWYPITVATISREIKKVILKYLELTGDPNLIDFKLHDFGFRGVSSVESAGIGGAAHLVNFKGTDTLAAIDHIYNNYDPERNEPMPGYSIPAAEHSTIVSWGRDRECEAYENMLDQYPEGYVAVVSDSYDIYNACENIWGEKLKQKVLNRNGTLVIRPDSGDPATVVCKVLDILWKKFGGSVNNKGYKVLDPHVRVIQGDGVDYFSIREILANMELSGFSADNIAFGMGGALLQKLNRDTQQFAFKCSSVVINNETHSVSKSPVGDVSKKSKEGRLKLIKVNDQFRTIAEDEFPKELNILQTVFEDGEIKIYPTFSEIRERAKVTKAGDL